MLTVHELGFLRLNERLAGGREYWTPPSPPPPHHNFDNFIDTKISLKKVKSILYTMLKKKIVFVCSYANCPGDA